MNILEELRFFSDIDDVGISCNTFNNSKSPLYFI